MIHNNEIFCSLRTSLDVRVLLLLGTLFCSACGREGGKKAEQAATPLQKNASTPVEVSSDAAFDLQWMPAETELIVQIDVQGILKSTLLTPTNPDGQFAFSLNEAKLDTGLGYDLKEMKRVTLGVTGISAIDPKTVQQDNAAFDPLKESSVAVFETVNPVDPKLIASLDNVTTTDHNGHPYFRRVIDNPEFPPLGIYLPGTNTIVVGPEPVIQKLLVDGPGKSDSAPFQFVNPDAHLAVSFVPQNLEPLRNAKVPDSIPAEFQKANQVVTAHADRFGLELSVNDDLKMTLKVHCDDPNQAAMLGVELDKISQYAKQQFAAQQETMGMLAGLLAPLVEQMSGTASGNIAEMKSTLPADTAKSFAGMVPMIMMMAGLGGGNMQMDTGGNFGTEELTKMLETAQPAANVTGLPANATMKASVHWNNSVIMANPDAVQPPQQLEVALIVQAEELRDAVAFGNLSLESATTQSDHLRQNTSMSMSSDPRELVLIDRANSWTPMPEDGVLIMTYFDYPIPPTESIPELVGSFKILTAGSQTEKTIPNALSVAQTGIEDAQLKAAGVELYSKPPQFEGSSERLLLSSKAGTILTGVQVLDKTGEPHNEVWPQSTLNADGSSEISFAGNEPGALDGASLTFTLNTDINPLEVNFTFKDLIVPQVEQKPTDAQLKLITWIPSSKSEAIKGIRVESQARWSTMTNYGSDGNPEPKSLELAINLSGPEAANPIALGEYKLDVVTSDTGALKPLPKSFGDDPYQDLVAYESMMFLTNEPATGAQAVLYFEHPEKPPANITSATGQLTFLTATDRSTLLIPDIISKMDTVIEEKTLSDADVKLLPKKSGNGFHLEVDTKQPFAVEDVELVDAQGRRLTDIYPGKSNFDGKLNYTFIGEGQLPEDCGLKITLNLGIKKQSIPFSFENVYVPAEPPAQEF